MRAVSTRSIVARFTLTSEDGVAEDADALPTVSVTDGAGTVISTGNAVHGATGKYTYTFDAPAVLDTLTATMTALVSTKTITDVQQIRMQDRRIVPLNLLRADTTLAGLSAEDFLILVDQAEDTFERALRYSPVVLGVRAEVEASSTDRLRFPGVETPQSVIALTYQLGLYTHVFDDTELARLRTRNGAIEYDFGVFTAFPDFLYGTPQMSGAFKAGLYTAHLTHGETDTPRDLARAFLLYCHYLGQSSDWPMRAKRVMSEQSDIWLQMADPETAPTGIPEVDATLLAYRVNMPVSDRTLIYTPI